MTAAANIGPLRLEEREPLLDVLRGLALLGILVLNMPAFGMPYQGGANPRVFGGDEGLDLLLWAGAETLVEGSMRGLFSMLFGAGFALFLDRLDARGVGGSAAATLFGRRMLALLGFGLLDGYILLWTGDILYTYALAGFFLLPFRNAKPGVLALAAALLLLLQAALYWSGAEALQTNRAAFEQTARLEARGLTPPPALDAASRAWERYLDDVVPEGPAISRDIEAHRRGYGARLRAQAEEFTAVQSELAWTGLLPTLDVWPVMLLGLAALRLGWLRRQAPRGVGLGLVGVGYGLGLPLSAWETWVFWDSGFDLVVEALRDVTYDLSRILMAAGHTGLVLLMMRCGGFALLQKALGAVGRMALSNYLLHSILALLVFSGAGLGLYGALSRSALMGLVLGFWAVNIGFSWLWLQHFRYGPAEWLWRAATYGTFPALKRPPASARGE
ncbi:MAG: DUF418 domain-containing protein [Hyphomonadaceae bacterium]|nr:DUF418 domain-containing protein [Hyphomonadaceae bacterium]